MNITPQINNLPLATVVNPQTDNLRRENSQREVITQTAAASKGVAEKGVASDKDKAKTPAQNNEHIDFANIRKQAEAENATISDQSDPEQNPARDDHKEGTHAQDDHNHDPLTDFAEQQEIKELTQRDREVRSHEQAHAAVGGTHTGSPTYTFTVGPDGKKYATSGEVSVDLSPVPGDPQATITKLQKVHAAALAPANPSIQDTRVAAEAARQILQAQSELLAEKLNGTEASNNIDDASANSTFDKFAQSDSLEDKEPQTSIEQSLRFDNFINATLNAQESYSDSRPEEIDARAGRIQNFYNEITQAYDKAPSSNFQLTA